MSAKGKVSVEAPQGWMPVNTSGTMWRYRTRGTWGVIIFRRDAEAKRLYEAIHQDDRSNDSTITTAKKRRAVRFAVEGK